MKIVLEYNSCLLFIVSFHAMAEFKVDVTNCDKDPFIS